MVTSLCAFVGSLTLAASPVLADGRCSLEMQKSFREAKRIVDSLRLDKAGQMRVFAIDGSEYTGGEALWMKGQLRDVATACEKGDAAAAVQHLQAVLATLKVHRAL
jgi:hypothetical protein